MNKLQSVHKLIRERLLAQAGLLEIMKRSAEPWTQELIASIRKKKWSQKFEDLMRTGFVMGALRYETPAIARRAGFKGRPWKIETEDMIARIRKFQVSGNLEHLVDVANLCMIQFEVTDHPKKHFSGQDRHDTDYQEVKP